MAVPPTSDVAIPIAGTGDGESILDNVDDEEDDEEDTEGLATAMAVLSVAGD